MSDDLVEITRGSHNGDTYTDGTMKEPRLLIHVLADEIARLRAELATARREGMEEAAILLEQIAVKEINGEYQSRLPRCVVTLSDGIAKIRAAAKEGK